MAAQVERAHLQANAAQPLPRRLEAEFVRDNALAIAGLLVRKIGGPSVRPYQPEGVWEAVAMIGSNTRDYKRDTGENLYRRSMYTFWKRTVPHPAMIALDTADRSTCAARRQSTSTPLQALTLLNDPVLAARMGAAGRVKAQQRTWDAVAGEMLAVYNQSVQN